MTYSEDQSRQEAAVKIKLMERRNVTVKKHVSLNLKDLFHRPLLQGLKAFLQVDTIVELEPELNTA